LTSRGKRSEALFHAARPKKEEKVILRGRFDLLAELGKRTKKFYF